MIYAIGVPGQEVRLFMTADSVGTIRGAIMAGETAIPINLTDKVPGLRISDDGFSIVRLS